MKVLTLVLIQQMITVLQALKMPVLSKKPFCKQFDPRLLQEELLSVEVAEQIEAVTV